MSMNKKLEAFLATLPDAERARFEQFAELLIENCDEVTEERVENEIESFEDQIEKKIEDAVEEIDFEDSIESAMEDFDIESDIESKLERAMRAFSPRLADAADNAIEEAMSEFDLAEAINEEISTNVDLAEFRKKVEKTESALSCFDDVSNAGFWRRLRWLVTGK